ncbi:acyltransferase [Bradyrhizobium sp.]|uniref:acyltransferase n=1 Tax=Bradyrhizobium sp. TaxID=376 RepID=UPI003C760295
MLPITSIKPPLLNLIGHRIHRSARIAVSVVLVDRLYLGRASRIGLFNLIRVKRLVMKADSHIGHLNHIHGDFSVCLKQEAVIGNRNRINRGVYLGRQYPASLVLGRLSGITAGHYVNLIVSVSFGDYSTLGGSGSQIWTHGYSHHAEGRGRDEIRRPVRIGSNVYIGSMCCIGPGVTLGKHVAIGSHSSVAKSLSEPGLYVSAELRYVGLKRDRAADPASWPADTNS